MGTFRFKRFVVKNDSSAMKVNTDGVLLGAAVPLSFSEKKVLDIGTGTGTIALILAQRLDREDITITGIDIDYAAAREAGENFRLSPWHNVLTSRNISLSDLEKEDPDGYDLIISNPPYYDSSLVNPDARKAIARHTDTSDNTLSYKELMDFAASALTGNGRLALILPADRERDVLRYGRTSGLFPCYILRVKTVERKAPKRFIGMFHRNRTEVFEEELTIMENGLYTARYTEIVKDFYL